MRNVGYSITGCNTEPIDFFVILDLNRVFFYGNLYPNTI